MRAAKTILLTLSLLTAGCGSFEGSDAEGTGGGGTSGGAAGAPGGGGTNGGAAGAPGDPRFIEDCSNGPLNAPIADCQPEPLASSGDPHADCVARINQLRWECQCLPPLQRWNAAEGCANEHSEYDSMTSPFNPHAGFRDDICSPGGWAQNECPGWNSTEHVVNGCLQAMWDEGPGEDFQEHGHYINMTNPSYSMVACGFYETSGGDVWSVQNFQ